MCFSSSQLGTMKISNKLRTLKLLGLFHATILGCFFYSTWAEEPANKVESAALKISQSVIPQIEYEARNIYEAVHYTMTVAQQSVPEVQKIMIVIGPMQPRANEKRYKLSLEKKTQLSHSEGKMGSEA